MDDLGSLSPDQIRLVSIWARMIERCHDPEHPRYPAYGGRGIKVDARWHSFVNFATDVSPRPEGLSLDRIDNDGDYSPENCRWATAAIQNRNRRDNIWLTIDGRTQIVGDWAEESGTCHGTIRHRLKNGWLAKEAVFGRKFAKRYPGVTFRGETLTLNQWAKRLGLNKQMIYKRITAGLSVEDALTLPPDKQNVFPTPYRPKIRTHKHG